MKRFTLFENLTNLITLENLVAKLKSTLRFTLPTHLYPELTVWAQKGPRSPFSLWLTFLHYKLVNMYKYISNNARYKIRAVEVCGSIYITIIQSFRYLNLCPKETGLHHHWKEMEITLDVAAEFYRQQTQIVKKTWCWMGEDHASLYFSAYTLLKTETKWTREVMWEKREGLT